jgi:hypothetical protein
MRKDALTPGTARASFGLPNDSQEKWESILTPDTPKKMAKVIPFPVRREKSAKRKCRS